MTAYLGRPTGSNVHWVWNGSAWALLSYGGGGAVSGSVTGTWRDPGNTFVTTGSVSIDSQNRIAAQIGSDVFFFVSGTTGLTGSAAAKSVFGGDVFVSGAISFGLSASTAGNIRNSNGQVLMSFRDFVNALNCTALYCDPSNNIWVGGANAGLTRPQNVILDSTTAMNIRLAGTNYVVVNTGGIVNSAGNSIAHSEGVLTPQFVQIVRSTDSNVRNLIVGAQGAWSGSTVNIHGGALRLQGGTGSLATGALGGGVRIELVPSMPLFEVAEPWKNVRIASFFRGSPVTSSFFPSGSGDLVAYIGDCEVIPTANPTSGGFLYSELGALKFRDPSGIVTQIAPSLITGSSGGAGEVSASYVVLSLTSSLANERVLTAGSGITLTDGGPGGNVTISLASLTSSDARAYAGYCTGSLTWNATTWTDITNVLTASYFDTLQQGIMRSGSTFTVNQDGVYYFNSFFNAYGYGQYIGFRLSSSLGTLLQQTTFADNQTPNGTQPPSILQGIVSLTSGSSVRLQYAIASGSSISWDPANPLNGENMRTGGISMFLIASPLTITQNSSTSVTGTWRDPGNTFVTTGSVSIDGQNRTASQLGSDVFFYVSGTINSGSSGTGKVAVFGGDVRVSGTLAIGTGSIYIDSNEIRWGNNSKLYKSGTVLVANDGLSTSRLVRNASVPFDANDLFCWQTVENSTDMVWPNRVPNGQTATLSITGSLYSGSTLRAGCSPAVEPLSEYSYASFELYPPICISGATSANPPTNNFTIDWYVMPYPKADSATTGQFWVWKKFRQSYSNSIDDASVGMMMRYDGAANLLLNWEIRARLTSGNSLSLTPGDGGGYAMLYITPWQWHHFGVTFELVGSSTQMTIYINGNQYPNRSTAVGTAIEWNGAQPWEIGGKQTGPFNLTHFSGQIQRLRVSNIVRPETYFRQAALALK